MAPSTSLASPSPNTKMTSVKKSALQLIVHLPLRTLTVCLAGFLSLSLQSATVSPNRSAASGDASYPAPDFTVPEGFVVDLVAGPPLVNHPIMAGFDDEGRLYVAENAGMNLKNTELDQQLPNYIVRLEDTDGDGFFDKSIRFAENMTFPQGALWHQGALYVCSPPGLWRLEDTDGNGVADKRKQIVTGLTYTGNAADVHGPFLHPNGRLYWCHGRKDHEVYQQDGTLVSEGKGARIWSCNPDGSDIQVFAGGGMDNPVELVFTPEGDIIGDVNLFYGRPRGDVLVHWLHGGAYPRHDQGAVVAEFTRTGDLLTEFHNFGHVAVSGIERYQSSSFGPEYQGNIFVTFFNTQKISRVALKRTFSTFNATPIDFLEAHSPDFHCTDVLEDADGSLLVLDTGGWFRIGCPTSQIAKPELLGAIYRVRKADAAEPTDPRGREIDWYRESPTKLAMLLDDPRFAVREHAIKELTTRPVHAVTPVMYRTLRQGSDLARLNAVWTLTRLKGERVDQLLQFALQDTDFETRHAACQAVGMHRITSAVPQLLEILRTDFPAVRREAATALGRIGDSAAVPALLQAHADDRQLEHAILYALIELGSPDAVEPYLFADSDELKRRALIILDQMPGYAPDPVRALTLLESSNEALLKVIADIVSRRESWHEPAAMVFNAWLDENLITDQQVGILAVIGPLVVNSDSGRRFIRRLFDLATQEPHIYALPTKLLAESPNVSLDPAWIDPLRDGLNNPNERAVELTIDAIRSLKSETFDEALTQVGKNIDRPPLLRVKALSATSKNTGQLDGDTFNLLTGLLAQENSAKIRDEAARLIAAAKLTKPQLLTLAETSSQAGPLEWPTLIQAFTKTRDEEVGLTLVKSLEASPGSASLAATELRRILYRYPLPVQEAANPLLEAMLARTELQAARLEEVLTSMPEGNPGNGAKIFTSATALCANCHRIDAEGGLVGPDLSRIGRIRTERDLLEAILFPSASLARDFETYSIDTRDGENHTGVIFQESSDAVVLALAAGDPIRIPRKDIMAIRPSSMSLMPQGIDQAMTPQQLADLVAYLRSRQ